MSEDESSDEDDVYTFSLSTKTLKDQPLFKIKVCDTPVTIMADSGASINILDETEYLRLPNRPKLEPSSVKIYGYQFKDSTTCPWKVQYLARVGDKEAQ